MSNTIPAASRSCLAFFVYKTALTTLGWISGKFCEEFKVLEQGVIGYPPRIGV